MNMRSKRLYQSAAGIDLRGAHYDIEQERDIRLRHRNQVGS
jgi:hypothetical protein